MSQQSKQKANLKKSELSQSTKTDGFSISYIPWIGLAIILITTYILYRPAIDHQFVNWDDQVYVENQDLVLKKEYSKLLTTPISLNYHPLTMISLAAQAPSSVSSLKAGPFIHLNILIHLINTMMVFLWVYLLTAKRWGVGLFVAAVFALHPMHVESVAWVSERKDVLYTLFFLAASVAYLTYKENRSMKWLVGVFVLFLFSVLSKAMAVVFPLVMILMDYWAGDNMKRAKTYVKYIPFFMVSLFFGLMAINVQSGGNFYGMLDLPLDQSKPAVAAFSTFSLWQRIQIASCGFVEYIKHFFYPFEISAFYPYPPEYKFSALAGIMYPLFSLLIVGVSLWFMKRQKAFFFGIGYYAITVALVLQFLSVGLALMADRYMYVPYIGLAFLVSYVVSEWLKKSSNTSSVYGIYSLAGLFVIMMIYKTSSQVGVWKDSESLWTQVLLYHPKEDLALANRGNYRGKIGNIEGAIKDLEAAISDGCNRSDVYDGLGSGYGSLSAKFPDQKESYVQKAKTMYAKAMELDPQNSNIRYNLGIAQLASDPMASMKAFQEALAIAPHREAELLPLIGLCQLNSGQYELAITTLTNAMSKGINTDAVFYYRGIANIGLKKYNMAKEDLRQAVIINPNNQDAKSRLEQLVNQ